MGSLAVASRQEVCPGSASSDLGQVCRGVLAWPGGLEDCREIPGIYRVIQARSWVENQRRGMAAAREGEDRCPKRQKV